MSSDPPSYASIFGELAAKKATTDGAVDFGKEAYGVMDKKAKGMCGRICCGIFLSLLGIALPIAEIVIGALNLKNCPAQYLLPIYLVVSGVFGLVSGGSSAGDRLRGRNDDSDEEEQSAGSKAAGCIGNCVGMFVFIWFICGNVWVFRMNECDDLSMYNLTSTGVSCFTSNTTFSSSEFYCGKLLYDFTYWEIIAKWILYATLALVILIGCCCCCIAFCCAGKMAKKAGQNVAMKGVAEAGEA